ncbi:MAG: uracil-DNA glycosylase [Chthoniobacterales bacterium]|nr:MAG: uracil-DNA glycosylase [Chthoniobacterales bacterium]
MTVEEFVDELSSISLPNVFNPYRDICPQSDHLGSPSLRRQNLLLFLVAMVQGGATSVWLGRDLGHRGGRRTGLALTDEFHLSLLEDTFGIVGIVKATIDSAASKERTATEVWKLLRALGKPVLLWNAFPFHPFDRDDPFSNRRHTSQEFRTCQYLLTTLLEWVNPATVIALGADAETALLEVGCECVRVRHPSYGGQADFTRQVSDIYGI